ncbi:MAG: caspase family protein, partial [Planctomycetes bacterium]|nr:caspase family protein [Planctomycetota bacterium]
MPEGEIGVLAAVGGVIVVDRIAYLAYRGDSAIGCPSAWETLVMRKTTALIVLVLLALVVQADLAFGATKWALVIGNASYKEAPLRCPVNDASDIAETLENLGFTVAKLTDANQQEMENAIRSLGQRVKEDDTALFYFSGHGLQVGGVNYLVPIGMQAHSEDEVKYKGVPAEMVLDKLETAGSRMNIIVLDACRSNPFKRYRSVGTGLAQMNSPAGTLIAYATAPGTVAFDGTGRNSPYTKHLIGNMRRPGVEIGMAFRQVRVGVMRETKDRQVPWESSSLTGTFHFAAVGDAAYYNNRGRAWHYRGDLDKAMAEFDQA